MYCALRKGMALVRLAALLFAVLAIGSCGGGGGGGGGSSGSKVFVADSGTHAIGSVDNPNPAPGNVKVDRIITGTSSNFINGNIPALFLDVARDQLYVSNETSIVVFNNARFANGPIDYNRRVAMLVPPGGNFNSLSLDSTRDMLYVGDNQNGVRVYDNASTLNETGGPSNLPNRTISGNFGPNFFVRDVAVDAGKNILYVATVDSTPAMSVVVFDSASTATGNLAPSRTISIPTSVNGGTMGLFIDSTHDRLFVADTSGDVFVIENASSKSGTPAPPDRTVILPSVVTRLAVDTVNDRLYAASSSALYVVPGVSTASGAVLATAALAAPGSIFTAVAVRP